MKTSLCILFSLVFGLAAYADIQDPPANDYGPTRKLGRGLGNILYGITEVTTTVCAVTDTEGDSAAFSYGVVKGFGRMFFRFGAGLYEVVTFPLPTYKMSYRPFYRSNIPWIHGGYTEFPPEMGFETRYTYVRYYTGH